MVNLARLGINTDKISVNETVETELRGMMSRAEVLLQQLSDQQVTQNDQIAALATEIEHKQKEIAYGAELAHKLEQFQSLLGWPREESIE